MQLRRFVLVSITGLAGCAADTGAGGSPMDISGGADPTVMGQPAAGAGGPSQPSADAVPTPSAPTAPASTDPGAPQADPARDPVDTVQPEAGDGDGFDHAGEILALDADRVVGAGEVLRLGPGTHVEAAAGVTLRVQGRLQAEGTAEAPVRFAGGGEPRSWEGIVVDEGGVLELSHVEISGATYGIHALPGSDFTVRHADIGTSFKCAVVQSDGFFEHVAFHASGDPTFSLSSAAPITDPNGNGLTIVDASPMVRHSTFDNGAPLVDIIRVRASSSPIFEHLHITEAHCGIHMEGGYNSSPTITNTVFEGLAYGIMAYAAKPTVRDSVFLNNAADVGFCFGATPDNVPDLEGNYYSAGAPMVDPSCTQIGTTDTAPASAPNPQAGPEAP